MSKANYTKVENALNEGMLKITVQQLQEIADGKTDEGKKAQGKLVALLKLDVRWISKTDPTLFDKLEINKSELKKKLEEPSILTSEEWKSLIQLKERINQCRKELVKPDQTDDQIIKNERVKHVNKRFNTNDKWLPLH